MTVSLASVASIALLVGGIGIMNILSVSVTERTRGIGIRMAVGAKARHISLQFLVESAPLSLLGGVFGILLVWLVPNLSPRSPIGPVSYPLSPSLAHLFSRA
jgi:ABC-type antimicrobial peptide transport system permease subunit